MALKRRVRSIVQIPSPPGDKLGQASDFAIIALIIANAVVLVIETIPGITDGREAWFLGFEWFSVSVFIVEYLLRLWSITVEPEYAHPVTGRLRWMATPMAVVDILAILPSFLALFGIDLRFLRVLRMLRIVKLGRYAESFQILGNVIKRSRRDLLTSAFLVGVALVLCSSFMYYAEKDAQPVAFSSIPAAMWWGIVALTTTGYGDVVPVTALGQFLGGLTAVLGVAAIALPIGILSSSFVQEIEARRKQRTFSASILAAATIAALEERRKLGAAGLCPHCGHAMKSKQAYATAVLKLP